MRPQRVREIRAEIRRVTKANKSVLDCGPSTFDVNGPRAMLQLVAKTQLDTLYWVLGEERPQFTCDDRTKLNH